jgi:hypothetical protein
LNVVICIHFRKILHRIFNIEIRKGLGKLLNEASRRFGVLNYVIFAFLHSLSLQLPVAIRQMRTDYRQSIYPSQYTI